MRSASSVGITFHAAIPSPSPKPTVGSPPGPRSTGGRTTHVSAPALWKSGPGTERMLRASGAAAGTGPGVGPFTVTTPVGAVAMGAGRGGEAHAASATIDAPYT